jgi:hypothetical protein
VGHFIVGSIFFVILLEISCNPISASPVSEQIARGQDIYETGRATENCHGAQREGIPSENGFRAWPLGRKSLSRC